MKIAATVTKNNNNNNLMTKKQKLIKKPRNYKIKKMRKEEIKIKTM
jgi:hypothetical protein